MSEWNLVDFYKLFNHLSKYWAVNSALAKVEMSILNTNYGMRTEVNYIMYYNILFR